MLEVTVKTIENQNHSFSVNDEITVAQFKEHIASTVSIAADTQRIIYCGRVLQDATKLNDYDVNGKVVHLVQRPPPSAAQPARPNPIEQQRRRFQGVEYLGSMRLPPSRADGAGGVPSPSTHSLAASRLNVAKRMLRKAESILNGLENPTTRSAEVPSQEENQEEVTPVFEARVFVPGSSSNYPIDEALFTAVENSIFRSANSALSGAEQDPHPNMNTNATTNSESPPTVEVETPLSVLSTPSVVSPLQASTENLSNMNIETDTNTETVVNNSANTNSDDAAVASTSAATNNAAQGNGTTTNSNRTTAHENSSTTVQYADLIDHLTRVQTRLAPFLRDYHIFMRDDPTVPIENSRETQTLINRVSEILHFLGHAYHSLSDIIVRVRTLPPRPLLCRPILIQQSAVVQAGIPIQVEAQINFPSDRSASNNGNANTNSTTTSTTNTTATSNSNNQAPPGIHVTPFVGLPLLGPRVHVETFSFPRQSDIMLNADGVPVLFPSNTTVSQGTAESQQNSNPVTTSAAQPPPRSDQGTARSRVNRSSGLGSSSQYPNMEFFIEVTPEGISVDSIETTLLAANQAGDIMHGSLNTAPPELVHSIMQMAGQLIGRSALNVVSAVRSPDMGTAAAAAAAATPTTAPATTVISSAATSTTTASTNNGSGESSSSETPTTANSGAARTTPFQNSQARGTTQTHPTTATYTRSTSRPHVHLAQHTMQGFDPFLPCNSHHITRRRRFHLQQTLNRPQSNRQGQQQQQAAQQEQPASASTIPAAADDQTANDDLMNTESSDHSYARNDPIDDITNPPVLPFINAFQSLIDSFHGNAEQVPEGQAQANVSMTLPPVPLLQWMRASPNTSGDEFYTSAPTMATLLQLFRDNHYTEGENISTDFIMTLSRHFTLRDIILLNSGRLDPLVRIRPQLRNFVVDRVLQGTQNADAIETGVNRIIREMQPFIENLQLVQTRDNIDLVASTQALLRARLPNIISLVISNGPNSLRLLVDQTGTTIRQAFALILHASQNGLLGVEEAFDQIIIRYVRGMPSDFQQWTVFASRDHFRLFLSHIDVPESVLRPYIIRKHSDGSTPVEPIPVTAPSTISESRVEYMEVDEPEIPSASTNCTNVVASNLTETDELPPVVIGTESWHSQVPRNWVPIITRDSQRQRKQPSQQPFSDAYLLGMPSKRRKLIDGSKLQGSLPQIISESVRRAITATGVSSSASVEVVAQAAGENRNIQSAYRDLLRNIVQSSLRNNDNFTPERFPNASNYFLPDRK